MVYSLACVLTVAAICLPLPPSCLAQENDLRQVSDATIDVRFDFTPSGRLRKLMRDRIKLSAEAVAAYYRQYPVAAVGTGEQRRRGPNVSSRAAFASTGTSASTVGSKNVWPSAWR
jgi:hypothetical protein